MSKTGFLKKNMKGFISLLLVFAVMVSLAVPFDISVLAEEEPARGNEICAVLYKIDENKGYDRNLELVLQKGKTVDDRRFKVDLFENFDGHSDAPPWYDAYGRNRYIVAVDVKDRIAPTTMKKWFMLCSYMTDDNFKHIDRIDTSNCTSFNNTFNYACYLENLDLTCWDTSNVTDVSQMFTHIDERGKQFGLKTLNISNWTLPKCKNFSQFLMTTRVEDLDLSSFNPSDFNNISNMISNNPLLKTVKLGNMTGTSAETNGGYVFANDVNLESVYSSGEPIPGHADLSSISNTKIFSFKSIFENCEKIESIDFGDNLKSKPGTRDYAYDNAFAGCKSLKKVDLKCCPGGLRAQLPIFKDCINLEEILFSNIEDKKPDKGYESNFNISNVPINIYEGCNELKEVTFNEKYPPAEKAGTSVPTKASWARIKNADGSDFSGKEILSADQLFLDFQKSYAGTWVAVDKIVLNATGGKPNQQGIDGSKGLVVEYNSSDITTPEKTGFDFDDWYSEKNGEGEKLESGKTAKSWTYYANWNEHKYTLILDGNGGKVPEGYTVDGGVISEDRRTITFNNIKYTQFRELSKRMFYLNENNVFASWNTRVNGKGTSYYVNDSVNKLAEADGATATLYAQWHESEAVIKFDSHEGTAVSNREYNVGDTYGDLSESYRAGYTFLGWYTAPNELGEETLITPESEVIGSQTLHAKWKKNPVITFDANGGKINQKDTTEKVCSYGYKIGTLPVPDNGSAVLKGWYTAQTGGDEITENTLAKTDAVYYAQWGYKPKFETNGGSFTSYNDSLYPIKTGENANLYKITDLPVAQKDYSTFDGWYFEGNKVNAGDTLDFSSSNVIKANWNDDIQYLVTLNYNDDGATPNDSINVYDGNAVGQLPSPKREGYDFEGWYDSGNVKYTSGSPAITDNVTLTAKWTQHNVTATFDPCGGSMVDSDTITVAKGRTIPSLPGANYLNAKGEIQYRFGGWYTEPNGDGTLLTSETPITTDTKYYAKWVDLKTQTDDDYVHSIHWATISNTEVTNTGGHLVFHPTVKGDINARLYISLERPNGGTLSLPAGKLQIKIPRHMFESDKEGNNLSAFFNATSKDDIKAKYSEDGESIILYNQNAITKNTILTPEFNINPTALKGGYTDDNGYYQGDYYEKSFKIEIDIDTYTVGSVTVPQRHYERDMGLEVHTNANTTATKARADVSLTWNKEWGDEAPVDANEYFYVIWKLSSRNSNCNQPYKLKWSEDTIHDGSVVYSDPPLNTWSGPYNQDATHSIKVVTKHRREDVHNEGGKWAKVYNEAILSVLWNDEYEQQFRASRTAEVYVPKDDSGGGFSFTKHIPEYDTQSKHSVDGGQELVLNDETNLMPLKYNIVYSETDNVDNPTWNAEPKTYTTLKRNIVIEDGAAGDVKVATYRGTDSLKWNSPYAKNLNESDYYFSKLDINLTEFDGMKLDGKWTEPYENTDYKNYGEIYVYARVAGSDSLERITTIRGVNKTTVNLPKNTVYFKVEHSSAYYTTKLSVDPTLYLTDSNRLRSFVSDDVDAKRETIVMNKCRLTTKRLRTNEFGEEEVVGNPIVQESADNDAWPSAYLLNISKSTLYAAKKCSTRVTEGSFTEETYVVIGGWNYNNSLKGYKKYMKSGIFNDLLPKDCTVDKNSVFVCPRTENTTRFAPSSLPDSANWGNYYNDMPGMVKPRLPVGYYSVSFKDNYEGSGRTMMTVNVNTPDGEKYTGFDVFYILETTYSNINTYGINLINSVSFTDTTNDQSEPDAREGNIKVLDNKSSAYYKSLDGPRTAFATDKTNLTQPPKFQYGADSNVRAEGSKYSKHEVVGLNTEYNYNVNYTSGDTSQTSDIIIYDVIEKQIGGSTSEWHGEFESLDISAIKALDDANGKGKCSPVVYYSTKSKDEFTYDDLDITKSDIWTTEKPDDSLITAVAIDCRKTTTGNDFVLDKKLSIGFNINLHSPSSERRSELETYNEAVIDGKITNLNVPIESKAQTAVTLRFANPKFVKSAFPKTGTLEKPESVVQGSVLEYVLTITNPDKELEMNNIVVEDVFSNKMKFNNTIKAKLGTGDNIPIAQFPRVSSYSVKEVGTTSVFTATIKSLSAGETIAITIPVTVTDEIGKPVDNKARITSINGVEYNIESDETHHVITENKVKVLKVNGKGDPLAGAELQILDEDKKEPLELTDNGVDFCTTFTSTKEVSHFNIVAGTYYLHEVSAPNGFTKASDDVKFSIDAEGIITVAGEEVDYVSISNTPKYKVIFHEGKTDGTSAQFSKVYKTYEPNELNEDLSIKHFYDIPSFAGDEYVFAGWYHNSDYSALDKSTIGNASAASVFEADKYPERDSDYHLYAKWIKVGKINKDSDDKNVINDGKYRGFGLAGVQIRDPEMKDSNYNNDITPPGMRYVTSLSEDLLRQIDEVSPKTVTTEENKSVNVEYGYVASSKENIDGFVSKYKAIPSEYTLQYRGENVNGVNTLGENAKDRGIKTDYRYIKNLNCTSNVAINGKQNGTGIVAEDHRNYNGYRLYTLVVTYEGSSAAKKGDSIDARAYIRYYDANGKLRVFYNNYNKTEYYGGCMCSFNQVASMAIPVQSDTEEP